MSITPRFLEQFKQKMTALENERGRVENTIWDRQQFTTDLKTKLGQIYQRLKILANLINQLKTKATTLETQVTSNNIGIMDKQQEIDNLKKQMLSDTNLKNSSLNRINVLEGQIKKYEEEIKTLNDKSNALKTELSSRGDQQKVHTDAINELTRKSREEKDQLVLELNTAKARVAQLQQNQNQNQGQANNLQGQITQLETENKDLIKNLSLAIKAITDSTADLKNLMDSVPNAKTKQEVDELVDQITQQIEGSISSLQNTSQNTAPSSGFTIGSIGNMFKSAKPNNFLANVSRTGQPVGQNGSQNTTGNGSGIGFGFGFGRGNNNGNFGSNPLAPPETLTDDTPILMFSGDTNPLTFRDIKAKLRTKMTSGTGGLGLDPNLASAWDEINNNAKTADDVAKILNDKQIKFTIGALGRGGKKIKSKKNKKQKGGFTYKKKFRRSGITSNSRYRKSSRTNRRSSR